MLKAIIFATLFVLAIAHADITDADTPKHHNIDSHDDETHLSNGHDRGHHHQLKHERHQHHHKMDDTQKITSEQAVVNAGAKTENEPENQANEHHKRRSHHRFGNSGSKVQERKRRTKMHKPLRAPRWRKSHHHQHSSRKSRKHIMHPGVAKTQ